MKFRRRVFLLGLAALAPAFWLPFASPLQAQTTGTSDDGGFVVRDGNAGYIDLAIPGNQIRFRYDSGYDVERPNRAEFFYAKPQPEGPGLPRPERSVDFQDASVYLESLLADEVSAFAELPVRFLNPEVNDNSAGLGDMNAGAKWAFLSTPDLLLSGQFRVYAPTGDADRGLGTDNTSLEPGLLFFAPLGDGSAMFAKPALFGELRYWIPVGGTDFAGDLIRYGLGVQQVLGQPENWRVSPVVEVVGWTVLDGRSTLPTGTAPAPVVSADGDTIVNLKLGTRVAFGRQGDVYAGYGRALTGEAWYEDTVRLELRLFY